MAELTQKELDAFETAINAPDFWEIETIRAAFKSLPHPDQTSVTSADICLRFCKLLDALLDYEPSEALEMAHNYTNADWISACAVGHIDGLLKGGDLWRRKARHELPVAPSTLLAALPHWRKKLEADRRGLQEKYWRALENRSGTLEAITGAMLDDLEAQDKIKAGTRAATAEAFQLQQQFGKMDTWPEAIEPKLYAGQILPLLEDDHAVKRNLGGWALGEIYGMASRDDIDVMGLPSHSDIFHLIAAKHRENGDIVSTFVDEITLNVEGLRILDELPFDAGFDWREWVLSLICDDENEHPIIGMPLWFPVHEYFAHDLDAVMRMIDRGKYTVAKLTAEEDWLPHMKPAVERLAAVTDEAVAADAQYSLDHYWPLHEQQNKD